MHHLTNLRIYERVIGKLKLISGWETDLSKRTEILAVHKVKLREFLEKLELWDSLQKGELKCEVCRITLTIDNIGLIIPLGTKIGICCTEMDCLLKMKQMKENKT